MKWGSSLQCSLLDRSSLVLLVGGLFARSSKFSCGNTIPTGDTGSAAGSSRVIDKPPANDDVALSLSLRVSGLSDMEIGETGCGVYADFERVFDMDMRV